MGPDGHGWENINHRERKDAEARRRKGKEPGVDAMRYCEIGKSRVFVTRRRQSDFSRVVARPHPNPLPQERGKRSRAANVSAGHFGPSNFCAARSRGRGSRRMNEYSFAVHGGVIQFW